MERILSQNEISELLSAVQHGDIVPEPEAPRGDSRSQVSRVDLVHSNTSGQIRFGNVDLVFDAFARNYAVSLTNRLQLPVTMKRNRLAGEEFELFLQRAGENTAMGLLRFDPFNAGGLLQLDSKLAYGLVEILLGGSLGVTFTPQGRPMTGIELNILTPVFSDATLDLTKVLGELKNLSLELTGIEGNPRMVNNIPADSIVAVAGFEVELADQKGLMALAIPMAILEPLRDKLQGEDSQSDNSQSWLPDLTRELRLIPTEISAQLGHISLEMRDFINFQVGDIIDLPWNPAELLTVLVEGQPKFMAQAGVRNGNKAIRVADLYDEGAHHGKQ